MKVRCSLFNMEDSEEATGEAARKATASMVGSLKECIDIAGHSPDSFIAVKVF